MTLTDGAVVSLGVDYAFPEKYPALGQSSRLEILGTEGVMLFDDDRKDQILYTERGMPRSYVPGHEANMVFLSSTTPGDWALGDFWGPLADETRAWLDHLCTGRPCVNATPGEARRDLEVTIAIEQSARNKKMMRLPLVKGGER